MPSESRDLTAILGRLEKVEQENRRLKRYGLAFLSLIAAVIVMGQARPSRTLEAEQFVLKDPQARVRATLGVLGDASQLNFYDKSGMVRASLMVVANGVPGLTLYDGAGNPTATLVSPEGGASLSLQQGAERPLPLQELIKQPGLDLYASKDGIALDLKDRDGFQTVVGSTDLVTPRTGETHKTSVASIVLFGKDGSTIWSTP